MFGGNKPPSAEQVPPIVPKVLSSGDVSQSNDAGSTSTLTQEPSFASFSKTTTPLLGGVVKQPEGDNDSSKSSSLFKRENANPFGKLSSSTGFPTTSLFSKTAVKTQPMPSATSLFEPSSSSSFFLSAQASVKPVFSATTLAKSNPNVDKPMPEKTVDVKPALYTSSNPFSFIANTKSNPKSLFGSPTKTAYKSSFSSPFSFVRKPEANAPSEKHDVAKTEVSEGKDEPSKEETKVQLIPDKLYLSKSDEPMRSRIKQRNRYSTSEGVESPDEKLKVDVQKYRSILLKGVPREFNNKLFVKKHFTKFGRVNQVKCNVKKNHTIVYFNNHEAAAKAKKFGGKLADGIDPIPVFYTTETNLRRKSSVEVESLTQPSPSKVISEVDDELRAMGSVPLDPPKLIKRRLRGEASSTSPSGERMEPKQMSERMNARKTNKDSHNVVKKNQPLTSVASVSSQPKSKQDMEPLVALLTMVASSSGERYKVLDARDKLMRMKVTKQSDIATAKAVQGTCPDMCPEKERYSRADKFCLSGFEMKQDSGQAIMDPRKVLKEYSRSSADQEEPLSHELRPVRVLQMTMDYLLCNVMDHPETSIISEWYDFIWNRTRAIRKDLTQQHLCDENSVSLVEKCARFHIHCSEALSEEDVAVFDPKINNENLTKCLQTLKHFYADLEEKGVVCPNEDEFRAYEILLNLNESDIASQVQTLRKEIRTSKLVIFANEVFQSLSNNNYVRFFALLNKATYLQACIMHRYFAQVRTKALKVILKAYRQPNQVTNQFCVDELLRILAFESEVEATQFCNWLQLHIEDNCISLNKPLGIPDGAAPIFRAHKYIEAKKSCTVGEIVNNGPLQDNPLNWYIPHNSFNENGLLKEVAYNSMDQADKTLPSRNENVEKPIFTPQIARPISILPSSHQPSSFAPSPSLSFTPMFKPAGPSPVQDKPEPVVVAIRSPSPPPPALSNEEILEIMEENRTVILRETLKSMTKEIALESIIDFQVHDSATKLLLETTEDILRNVASESMAELKHAKDRQERAKQCVRVGEMLNETLTEEVIENETRAIAILIHCQLKEEMRQRVSTEFMAEILNESIAENLSLVVEDVHQEEIDWKSKIELFKLRKALQRCKKYFLRWKKICAQRKTLDFVRRTFPAAPPIGLRNFDHLKVTSNSKSLLDVSHEEKDAKKNIDSGLCVIRLSDLLIRHPLNVLQTIGPALIQKYETPPRFIPFKIVLTLPGGSRESQIGFANWLVEKFCFSQPILSDKNYVIAESVTYSIPFDKTVIGLNSLIVGNGIQSFKEPSKLLGLSCIVIFFDILEDNLKTFKRSLGNLLRSKPKYPPVPIAVLMINFEEKINQKLHYDLQLILEKFSQDFISDYMIKSIDFHAHVELFNNILTETLTWLAEGLVNQPVLESVYLRDYLEDGIRKYVLDHIFHDLTMKQRQFKTSHIQAIDSILHLYNYVIEHLINVACNYDLSNYSWPPAEFNKNLICYSVNWNHSEKLKRLKDLLQNLLIDQSCVEDLDHLQQESVFKFITNVFGPEERVVTVEINDMLQKYPSNFVPWAEVFVIIVQHLLNDLNYLDEENGKEITVHYDSSEFDEFELPTMWLEATRDSTTELKLVQMSEKKNELNEDVSDILPVLTELEAAGDASANFKFTSSVLLLEKMLSDEREEAKRFRKKLLNTVEEDKLTGNAEWIPQTIKHKLSFKDNYTSKKPKMELSDYIHDDVLDISNALKSEKTSNNIFRKRLEQILND